MKTRVVSVTSVQVEKRFAQTASSALHCQNAWWSEAMPDQSVWLSSMRTTSLCFAIENDAIRFSVTMLTW